MKACRRCKRIYETDVKKCVCGSEDFTREFKGIVIVIEPEKSEIAKQLEIKEPGKYALRV